MVRVHGDDYWDGEYYDLDPYDAAEVAKACGLAYQPGNEAGDDSEEAGTGAIDLKDLLQAYDSYIQTAFEARLPEEGWCPVCVEEFMEYEYVNVWRNGHSFDYMYKDEQAEQSV